MSDASAELSQPNYPDALHFECKVDSAKMITRTINGIYNAKKDQYALCTIEPKGINFVVQDAAKCSEGSGFLRKDLFQEWVLEESVSPIRFRINLTLLLDCLNIFGSPQVLT